MIKLCCLIDPLPPSYGLIQIFGSSHRLVICKQCYSDLLDSIPNNIRATETHGVWDAMTEYIHLKFEQEHLKDE